MKITKVKIEKFSAPLKEPFRVAFGVIEDADSWTVKIETDEGIYGLGSAAPLAFVTGETMDTCYIVMKMFADAFIGFDPMDIAGAHKLMDSIIYSNGAAKCAFDLALYDIIGKKKGLPVYKVLGGTDPVVHNDITIGINAPEKMEADAKEYVFEKGFRILKVKTGLDLATDIRALTLIRNAVGPDVRIRIDANQGYSVETALKALPEFEKLGIDAAEQFLPWWDFEGAAELKRKNTTSVKLMLDESIHNIHDAHRAAKLDCADFYNIKLMKCGGLYCGAQIADIAPLSRRTATALCSIRAMTTALPAASPARAACSPCWISPAWVWITTSDRKNFGLEIGEKRKFRYDQRGKPPRHDRGRTQGLGSAVHLGRHRQGRQGGAGRGFRLCQHG